MSGFDAELNVNIHESRRPEINPETIDVNTNLALIPDNPISFESVLKKCGDLGRFQLFHLCLISLIAMSSAVLGYFYVFGAAEPYHRCRLPETLWPNDNQYYPINKTHEDLINEYIPKNSDGKNWDSCYRRMMNDSKSQLISCPDGWVYDRSVFGFTFTEEANLVCDNEVKKSWLATLFQFGGLFLIIIGPIADGYGRKRLTVIVMILLLIISVMTQMLMQFVPMSIDVKFALLVLNQFASGLTASAFSLTFVLALELTSSAHMSFAGNVSLVAFSIGETIVTAFAFVASDWQILKWLCVGFVSLVVFYLYWMPESPLYLLSKRDYHRLEKSLRNIAKLNKRDENQWLSHYQDFAQLHQSTKSQAQKSFVQQLAETFRVGSLRLKLFVSASIGFTTLMLYIKISYGLTSMDISPYLGILIGAGVEAIGYVSGSLLINTRLARKGSFIIMMILTTICVTLIPILQKRSPLTTVFIAQFGKFAISGAIAVSWIFVPELFPTSIRGSANGFFIGFSRAGAILAPVIDSTVNDTYLPYTFYASSVLSVIVIGLTFLLPETKDKSMGDEEN